MNDTGMRSRRERRGQSGPRYGSSMELFEEVVVVTDVRSTEEAYTVRSVLEFYRLRVRFERLVQRRQLDDFFAGRLGTSPCTVVMAHGAETDDGRAIRFMLVDNADGDPKAADGWEPTTVDLTASTIPNIVTSGSGALIVCSCGGGDSSLAEAFLQAGYDAYVGETEPYYSSDASLMFVTGLFYFLLAETETSIRGVTHSKTRSPARQS